MTSNWNLPVTSSSILDEDLDLSSSDEETEKVMCINEDEILRDDEGKSPPEPQQSTSRSASASFYLDASASEKSSSSGGFLKVTKITAPSPSASKRETSVSAFSIEEGEITYDKPELQTLSSTKIQLNKKTSDGSGDFFGNMDLDEYIRQRNILPIPKPPHHHRFHYDRPITGARSKFYNIDPRQNMSLDDIIKMVPTVSRDNHGIRRRHYFADTGRSQQQNSGQSEKLRKGVETVTEAHPDKKEDIFKEGELPEGQPDPLRFLEILISKGYSIYWSLMKRKNCENMTEEEKGRMYRCFVSYNKVEGICEGGTILQAKHGAAINFLQKLCEEFPALYRNKFPKKLDEALLLDTFLLNKLITNVKEKYGEHYNFRCRMQTDKPDARGTLHKCTLFIESSKYEGYSYLSSRGAKLLAAKAAYEDLLNEPCPMQKPHIGIEQCTGDESIFRNIESQMMHCYDLSRVDLVDPENLRSLLTAKKGNPFRYHGVPRLSRCVQVSFITPR